MATERRVLPQRTYRGATGNIRRHFHLGLPLALDAEHADFVYVDPDHETATALCAWGAVHREPWAMLRHRGSKIAVVAADPRVRRQLRGHGGFDRGPRQRCPLRRAGAGQQRVRRRPVGHGLGHPDRRVEHERGPEEPERARERDRGRHVPLLGDRLYGVVAGGHQVRQDAAEVGATTVHLILVDGHEVASSAEGPAIAVRHGVPVWVAVIAAHQSTAKEYRVTMPIPSASMDAGRSVTAVVDAALAAVGTSSPEDAAGGAPGRTQPRTRAARSARPARQRPRPLRPPRPARMDRALPQGRSELRLRSADHAARPGRCAARSRRGRGRGEAPEAARIRRTGAQAPEPGYLAVEWTAPAVGGGPVAARALVEIDGPGIANARAPGLELSAAGEGNRPRRFALAADMRTGPVLEFQVPDRRLTCLLPRPRHRSGPGRPPVTRTGRLPGRGHLELTPSG